MRNIAIGRSLRMVRIRRGLRQQDVAERAGVSASVVARHERGTLSGLTAIERHAAAIGLRADLRLSGKSGELVRLADEEHAAIVELLGDWLRSMHFILEPEASFNEWGERGRLDLLTHDPRSGVTVIVEVKTLLLDLQALLGALNVRERLAETIGRRRGWKVRRVVTVLAVADVAANRAVVRAHRSLFSGFVARRISRAALDQEDRILMWVSPRTLARRSWISGRQRVRKPTASSDRVTTG
jgi:transcriptional regulator with XRE-family HTH domain